MRVFLSLLWFIVPIICPVGTSPSCSPFWTTARTTALRPCPMHSVKISLRFETDQNVPTRQLAISLIPNCLQNSNQSNQTLLISKRYPRKRQILSRVNFLEGRAMEFSSLAVTISFALQSQSQKAQAKSHRRPQVPKWSARAQVKPRRANLLMHAKTKSHSTSVERCALANGQVTYIAERDSEGESPRESTTSASSPVGNIVTPT